MQKTTVNQYCVPQSSKNLRDITVQGLQIAHHLYEHHFANTWTELTDFGR